MRLTEPYWSYKDHGKDFHAVFHEAHPPGFRWLHTTFGTNWRMTELQAAVGRVQLRRLPEWVARRRALADILATTLGRIPSLRIPSPPAHIEHARYKFYAFVRPEWLMEGWDRDTIIAEINKAGVPCMQGICGMIQMEKAFTTTPLHAVGEFRAARDLMDTSLMFLVHPTLELEDMQASAEAIASVMTRVTRREPLPAAISATRAFE